MSPEDTESKTIIITPITNAGKPLAETPEQIEYRALDSWMDVLEGKSKLAEVVHDKRYQIWMADRIGVEVASLYVAPDQSTEGRSDARAIEFLSDAVDGALNFPMFLISDPIADGTAPHSEPVDDAIVTTRRKLQKQYRKSPPSKLSADLCAKHLRKNSEGNAPTFLLLPFGEILAYCFLYHVLEGKLESPNSEQRYSWTQVALQAWERLCAAYRQRPGIDRSRVDLRLLTAIKRWYLMGDQGTVFDRSFLDNAKIAAVYSLEDQCVKELRQLGDENKGASLPRFLEMWAEALYKQFSAVDKSKLMEHFWNVSLINPIVEEKLCTQGLYVTIIRSPLVRHESETRKIVQVYAICTLINVDSIMTEGVRLHLDTVLRRLSYADIVEYDYIKLKHDGEYNELLLQLMSAISNPDVDWKQLMADAAAVCHQVCGADYVLVSWVDVGVLVFHKHGDSSHRHNPSTIRWFSHLSSLADSTRYLAAALSREGCTLSRNRTKAMRRALESISNAMDFRTSEYPAEEAVSFGDSYQGLLLVFRGHRRKERRLALHNLGRIGLALEIGMGMPFRGAIRKGVLSSLESLFIHLFHPFRALRCVWVQLGVFWGWWKRDGGERDLPFRVENWLIASILELTRLGFMAIGFMFVWSVFLILFATLWHSGLGFFVHTIRQITPEEHGARGLTNVDIVETLGNIEHLVMAFSICLAATGVIFLLKPEMAAGQPKWMRSFAELGTLEKTLVRLAAMVLTIDALTAALHVSEVLEAKAGMFLETAQPVVFRLGVYLVMLVGLAFLSKSLLDEDSQERKNQKGRWKSGDSEAAGREESEGEEQ